MSARNFILALIALLMAVPVAFRPEDVPKSWRPWGPLDLTAQPGPMTGWHVWQTLGDERACLGALRRGDARIVDLSDRPVRDGCGIPGRVRLAGLSTASLSPVETRCGIAARLYLWERHVLQPAAKRHLGARVSQILHYSSYSCRQIRTARGSTGRMSQHATANAIDISGFVLSDGRRITLSTGWSGDGPQAAFLREARDGLCDWFRLVLSPDYNALHADHFHADMGPWPGCR